MALDAKMGYFQVRYNSRVVIYNRRNFIRLTTRSTCDQANKEFVLTNYKSTVILLAIF